MSALNFNVIIGRAACEACSATWNFVSLKNFCFDSCVVHL
jgi:hypothetical protein